LLLPSSSSTTSAVITFVMLAIGRSTLRLRLHIQAPVTAFTSSPPAATTPLGPVVAGPVVASPVVASWVPARTVLACAWTAPGMSRASWATASAPTATRTALIRGAGRMTLPSPLPITAGKRPESL
jgi:hypothetical protein